jgi:[ribosomal protein S18]-alanine N-acetyltransferase
MTQASFTIRPLAYADLPQVIAIERRAFTSPWSLAMFVLELSKPTSLCLAAVDTDGHPDSDFAHPLVGYLVCSRFDTVWHLMNVAVDPDLRRRGIGWALLQGMIAGAGPDEPYTLEVRESNTPAIEMYERLHFRAAGKRPRYYRDNGEDAVIMWRTSETVASAP